MSTVNIFHFQTWQWIPSVLLQIRVTREVSKLWSPHQKNLSKNINIKTTDRSSKWNWLWLQCNVLVGDITIYCTFPVNVLWQMKPAQTMFQIKFDRHGNSPWSPDGTCCSMDAGSDLDMGNCEIISLGSSWAVFVVWEQLFSNCILVCWRHGWCAWSAKGL